MCLESIPGPMGVSQQPLAGGRGAGAAPMREMTENTGKGHWASSWQPYQARPLSHSLRWDPGSTRRGRSREQVGRMEGKLYLPLVCFSPE